MSIVSVEKDVEQLSLVLVAEFEAPIEAVWQLWADPRKLERWWGPPTWPATVVDHELTVGGAVGYFMTGPEGETSRGWWRVTAVEPPRSLEFTDGFADRDGAPLAQSPTTEVTVRLSEQDGLTSMRLQFVFASPEHMAHVEQMGAFDVFPQCVAQMDGVLAADDHDQEVP